MNLGKRHLPAPSLGRHVSVLMSVIALALACFPVLAHAEECTSSSCVQYDPSIPRPEGEHTPTHHQKTPAKASKTGEGGGSGPTHSDTGSPQAAEEGSEEESSSKEGAVVGGSDSGKPQGKAGGSAKAGAKEAVHPGAQNESGTLSSQSADDGGSSPLVPILIAIAVMAAISVAVVMIRQRRQRRGPTATASPEAN